jgi:hypothetical protein
MEWILYCIQHVYGHKRQRVFCPTEPLSALTPTIAEQTMGFSSICPWCIHIGWWQGNNNDITEHHSSVLKNVCPICRCVMDSSSFVSFGNSTGNL